MISKQFLTVLMNLLSWGIIKPFKTMATQPKKMNYIFNGVIV